MKIILTGSLGNIGKPLTIALVERGHAVTVISSKPDRQPDIEALGATAVIGSVEDVPFLAATFAGADAVYCMVPPNYFTGDLVAYYSEVGGNYAQAIRQSGVKRVVNLSSMGAHLAKGTGIIVGSHDAESKMNELSEVAITHIRAGYMYYNLLGFVDMIKETGSIMANYGGEDKIVLVSPIDVAAAIAEELETPATGHQVRYVASDERTVNEMTHILGASIGQPELKWTIISNEQMQGGLEVTGLPPLLASYIMEMYASVHSGVFAEDYFLNKPQVVMGTVKMIDYAPEFAAAFNEK